MTTTTPKNQTGVYAGNSLQEIKPIRTQINGIPISALQQRSTGNQLAEQNRLMKNAFQSYYAYGTSNGVRNGFRPSIVRRQKQRVQTAITPCESARRESREYSSKDLLLPTTPSSARLKSEIDQLNSQLKVYGDLNRILRLQNERVRKRVDRIQVKVSSLFRSNICSPSIISRYNKKSFYTCKSKHENIF